MDNENQQVPPVPNQPPIKTSKNLSFYKTLAYGFVIVSVGISIAIGGYLFGANKTKTQPAIQASVTPAVSPTPDPTANWKIYTNTTYKYSIKYPDSFEITSKYGESVVNITKAGETYYFFDVANLSGLVGYQGKEVATASLNAKDLLILDLIQRCKKLDLNQVSWKLIMMGEINGFQAMSEDICVKQYVPWSRVTKDNQSYSFSFLRGSVEEYNQILSTFKFTGQNQANPTANWKTYLNTEEGFEIKYPDKTEISKTNIAGGVSIVFQITLDERKRFFEIQTINTQKCVSTSGADSKIVKINNIDFVKYYESRNYSGTISTSAYKYCAIIGSTTYNLIPRIESSNSFEADSDSNLNQMLSTFKFTN